MGSMRAERQMALGKEQRGSLGSLAAQLVRSRQVPLAGLEMQESLAELGRSRQVRQVLVQAAQETWVSQVLVLVQGMLGPGPGRLESGQLGRLLGQRERGPLGCCRQGPLALVQAAQVTVEHISWIFLIEIKRLFSRRLGGSPELGQRRSECSRMSW